MNEEQTILKAYEEDKLKTSKNAKELIEEAKQVAKNTLKKDRSITIRLNSWDVERLQATALKEGLAYQTYISSQLHKLAEGRLVEKKN